MSEFFAMGGYAAYVWPSFGITLFVMALIQWTSFARRRKAIAAVKRQHLLNTQAAERNANNGEP